MELTTVKSLKFRVCGLAGNEGMEEKMETSIEATIVLHSSIYY